MDKCAECKEELPDLELKECTVCNQSFCEECITECDSCGESVCCRCVVDNLCVECRDLDIEYDDGSASIDEDSDDCDSGDS